MLTDRDGAPRWAIGHAHGLPLTWAGAGGGPYGTGMSFGSHGGPAEASDNISNS